MLAAQQRQKMGGNERSVALQSLMTLSSKFSKQGMVIRRQETSSKPLQMNVV
jgi:hypothetical protein